jgi:biotin carboxylase
MMQVAIVNPVSSGSALVEAFENHGAKVISIYAGRSVNTVDSGYVHVDLAQTEDYLQALQVDYVVAGSEFGVEIAEELAFRLDRPTNEHSTRHARIDKSAMFECIRKEGLTVAPFHLIASRSQLAALIARGLEFPVFVKPKSSAGSDGCARCNDELELIGAFEAIHNKSNLLGRLNEHVIVQEYIVGPQFIVNSISLDKQRWMPTRFTVHMDTVSVRC